MSETVPPSADGAELDLDPFGHQLLEGLSDVARPHVVGVVAAMHRGDVAAAEVAARAVPAHEREAVATAVHDLAWLVDTAFVRPRAGGPAERRSSALAFWRAAVLLIDDGAALGNVLRDLSVRSELVVLDEVRAVLASRPAAFRRGFGTGFCTHTRWRELGRGRRWVAARTLAAEGLIPPPRDVDPTVLVEGDWRQLAAARRADPGVGDVLDRIWTTPKVGQVLGCTWGEEYRTPPFELRADRSAQPDEAWAGLLDALGAADPERRPGVLDACLAALAGAAGERPSDLRGWALVHGRLEVDDAEAAARQSAYHALAAGGAAPAAAVARGVLGRLLHAGSLDADELLESAADALLRPEKGAVREYLDLLERAVDGGLVSAAACAEVVGSVAAELPRGVDTRARQLLARWEPAAAAAPSAPTEPSASVAAWRPPAPVDVPASAPVEAVAGVDDLVDLLLQVLSGGGHPMDVERALDGMLRLRDPSPAVRDHLLRQSSWGSARLVDHLRAPVAAWLGYEPQAAAVSGRKHRRVRAWDEADVVPGSRVTAEMFDPMVGVVPPGAPGGRARKTWRCEWEEASWVPAELVAARFAELPPLVTGPPVRSLALPTHADGGVDGVTLRARLAERVAAGRPVGPRELATALQRLDPGDRDEVAGGGGLGGLGSLGDLGGRAVAWLESLARTASFRRVVVEPREFRYDAMTVVEPMALWQPADVPARPTDDDDVVPWWLDTTSVLTGWTEHGGARSWLRDGDVAAWLLHLPWHPDVAAVHMQPEVVLSTELKDADLSGLLALLAVRRAPLGSPATDLLTWAATYRNARVRAAAAEAVAAAARCGALDGAELGRSVLRLAGPDAGPFVTVRYHQGAQSPKLSRIASTLADAARVDEHGEGAVLAAVVATLPELRAVRGGVALLEVGAQIAERRGLRVALPEPLASLAAGRAGSRLAEEARRIGGVGRTAVLWEPAPAR